MEHEPGQREAPRLFVALGGAVAAIAVLLAAASGGPYLDLGGLNPWLVVFAIALFAALFAAPFAIHDRLGGMLEADARWERALLIWGGVCIAVAFAGLLLGLPSGFASDSLAGSLGIVIVVEAAMVLVTLLFWLLSG